eukprot:scaffold224224_cov28-Tisochrysis_lutea.AAC.12
MIVPPQASRKAAAVRATAHASRNIQLDALDGRQDGAERAVRNKRPPRGDLRPPVNWQARRQRLASAKMAKCVVACDVTSATGSAMLQIHPLAC